MRFSFFLTFAVQAQAVVLASDRYENDEEQRLLMHMMLGYRKQHSCKYESTMMEEDNLRATKNPPTEPTLQRLRR